ncbi:MAG: UDP-galactopyranose mutase [Clostridiales bacterium]|jgi:UDP-galactopyranose mutase|nr:UDP-galactopyranose mutase [Clostridiales bacterium]
MYDYLIVGSGLFGATFAYLANQHGKRCLVIDKRNKLGGNIFTKFLHGICVHQYGAHIFHTSDVEVWNFVNKFAKFDNFINSPLAIYEGQVFNLPFNLNTFNRLWGTVTPQQAKEKIAQQLASVSQENPVNLEQQAIKLVGEEIYEKLIKGYTQKQWGRPCDKLPSFIIKRLPLRWTYDNNYFSDTYQGIPSNGYTQMIENMLKGIEVRLNVDYFDFIKLNKNISKKTVYTGMIDQFFDYRFGELEYRSLRFDEQTFDTDNYQGNAVVNYTSIDVPYTRTIEHRHFSKESCSDKKKTIVTFEYPQNFNRLHNDPYYPICDDANNGLLAKYQALQKAHPNIIFGGRLGEYKYYDMDKVIKQSILAWNQEKMLLQD